MPWPFKGPFKDELKFTITVNFLEKKKKKEWWSGSIWANGRKLWIRNLWVLITGFAAGLIWNLGQQAVFLPRLFRLHNVKYSCTLQRPFMSFYSWVYWGLPCQRGCNGPLKAVLRCSGMGNAHGRAVRPSSCSLQLFVACAGPWHHLLPLTETFHFPYTSSGLYLPLSSLQSHKYNDLKYYGYKL